MLPTSPSGRLLLFTWWLFMMILTSMYTANLTTNLTVESLGTSIATFEQLAKNEFYSWGYVADRYIPIKMSRSTDMAVLDVYKGGEKLASVVDAVKKLKEGRFVFIESKSYLEYTLRNNCKKVIAVTAKLPNQWALGLPLNAPYKEAIDKMFISYREEGLFTQLYKKWHGGGGEQCATSPAVGSDEKFDHTLLTGLFLILLGGVVVAFITSCFEFLVVSFVDCMESDETFSQCLRARIHLKIREICEEWFSGRCIKEQPDAEDTTYYNVNSTANGNSTTGQSSRRTTLSQPKRSISRLTTVTLDSSEEWGSYIVRQQSVSNPEPGNYVLSKRSVT